MKDFVAIKSYLGALIDALDSFKIEAVFLPGRERDGFEGGTRACFKSKSFSHLSS